MPYCGNCGKEYREGEPYCRNCGFGFEVSTGILSRMLAFVLGGIFLLQILIKLDYFVGAGFPLVSRLRELANLSIAVMLAGLAIRPNVGMPLGITNKLRYKLAVLLLIGAWIAVPYIFNTPKTLNTEGNALFQRERYEEALTSYDTAIGMDQGYAEAWFNRAGTLGMLGRYEESILACDVVLELEPDNARAWYFKGLALGSLGRYDEALEAFDGAVKIDQDYKEAWSDRGVALDYLGRYDEAIHSFDRALDIDPEYAPAISGRDATLARVR